MVLSSAAALVFASSVGAVAATKGTPLARPTTTQTPFAVTFLSSTGQPYITVNTWRASYPLGGTLSDPPSVVGCPYSMFDCSYLLVGSSKSGQLLYRVYPGGGPAHLPSTWTAAAPAGTAGCFAPQLTPIPAAPSYLLACRGASGHIQTSTWILSFHPWPDFTSFTQLAGLSTAGPGAATVPEAVNRVVMLGAPSNGAGDNLYDFQTGWRSWQPLAVRCEGDPATWTDYPGASSLETFTACISGASSSKGDLIVALQVPTRTGGETLHWIKDYKGANDGGLAIATENEDSSGVTIVAATGTAHTVHYINVSDTGTASAWVSIGRGGLGNVKAG